MKRVKWKFLPIGYKSLDPKKWEFHITPVLTYARVIHPTLMGNGHVLAIEWGIWALSIGRFVFDKPSAN